jgi:hypothetical protein
VVLDPYFRHCFLSLLVVSNDEDCAVLPSSGLLLYIHRIASLYDFVKTE